MSILGGAMIRTFSRTLTILGTLAVASAASAQEPKQIGTHGDWAAYSYKGKNGPVCYIVSQPKDSSPKNVNRDPIHFLVTRRPSENVSGEVNTIIGYPFKKGSTAKVTIDGNNYTLFTSGDGAWADSAENDSRIVAAMKAGAKMVVHGESWRGTKTEDQYSLSGVTNALNAIAGNCN